MTEDLSIREATAVDFERIADLHAASWRVAYRGVFSDAYLDGPIEAERRSIWRKRFAEINDLVVMIAERAGRPVGFIAWIAAADRGWGGLIDNFHVLPEEKGKGVGRRLFAAVVRRSLARDPAEGLYLYVLEQNAGARLAYERLGGMPVESLLKPEPDGREHVVLRYAWAANDLAAGSEPKSPI